MDKNIGYVERLEASNRLRDERIRNASDMAFAIGAVISFILAGYILSATHLAGVW